jgi:hypothetical protein
MGQCMIVSAVYEPRGEVLNFSDEPIYAEQQTVPNVFSYGTPRSCEPLRRRGKAILQALVLHTVADHEETLSRRSASRSASRNQSGASTPFSSRSTSPFRATSDRSQSDWDEDLESDLDKKVTAALDTSNAARSSTAALSPNVSSVHPGSMASLNVPVHARPELYSSDDEEEELGRRFGGSRPLRSANRSSATEPATGQNHVPKSPMFPLHDTDAGSSGVGFPSMARARDESIAQVPHVSPLCLSVSFFLSLSLSFVYTYLSICLLRIITVYPITSLR